MNRSALVCSQHTWEMFVDKQQSGRLLRHGMACDVCMCCRFTVCVFWYASDCIVLQYAANLLFVAVTCDTCVCCRFIVEDTVEENVARLSRERAAAMDMTAAVPGKGGARGSESAQLTVREVAALVCSRWRDGRD